MSTDRDVTRTVRSWLDEGVNVLPDRVLDAVLDQLPATPQRRATWLARRFPPLNTNIARIGVAAAAVVLAIIIGINFLPGSYFGGPPEATPTPHASPVTLNSTDLNVPLAGGRYAFDIGASGRRFEVELAMEAGWVAQELAVGAVTLAGPTGSGAWVGFFSIQRVYRDPCHPEDGYAGGYIGPSNSQDLVSELRALAGFDAGPNSTVRIGDLTATHFVISNTIDTDAAGCADGQLLPLFITWEADRDAELATRTTNSPATNGGTSQEVWIVDRNLYPLVIIGEVGGANPDADRAALQGIIDSISLGS